MNTPQEFAALLAALRDLPLQRPDAALVTLTRTLGSTFRRAGARMLVHGDGRIVRGLSAGCPEQDIAARAREAIIAGEARVLRYDREHGHDVMIEMGCGGEIEVLVEPVRSAGDWAFAERVAAVLDARNTGVLATLFRVDGACLPQSRHWMFSASVLCDEFEDAGLSAALAAHLQRVPASGKPYVVTLPCRSGLAELFIDPLQPPCAAVLIGNNASATALARLLGQLGWVVHALDPRQVPPAKVGGDFRLDARSFAVVMTHNLEQDIAYLRALRDAPLAYLGAVGARKRAAKLMEATGLTPDRLRAPAGLDIGSETPEEIALAIAAEMLSVANGTAGGMLSATREPIHR